MDSAFSLRFSLPLALCLAPAALAQGVIQDGSLGPAETLTGPFYLIPQEGGTTIGNNLFHSFRQFNIDLGEQAYFLTNPGIQNILTRVTGPSPSRIDGLIGTFGPNINLFFLNPNGVFLGPNAQLDLTGSFLISTADRFQFVNGSEFSATNPQAPPLLTLNPNLSSNLASSLNLAATPALGSISQAGNLSLAPGSVLMLHGQDIQQSGNLLVPGGQIQLLGDRITLDTPTPFPADLSAARISLIANNITVNAALQTDATEEILLEAKQDITFNGPGAYLWTLGGNATLQAGNQIALLDGAQIDTAPFVGDAGSLELQGRSLLLTNGAQLKVGAFSDDKGGLLSADITDSIDIRGIGNGISGFGSSGLISQNLIPGNSANSSDIQVNTARLSLLNGGSIGASSLGSGNGGKIGINASTGIEIDGFGPSPDGNSPSGIAASSQLFGNAGAVRIISPSLSIRNGGIIGASTTGAGEAGAVEIQSQKILVTGASDVGQPSGIFARSNGVGGDAGRVLISTQTLTVRDQATVSADGAGAGKSGNMTLKATEDVNVLNGGIITVSNGQGNGQLNIDTARLTVADLGVISLFGSPNLLDVRATESIVLKGGSIDGNTVSASNASQLVFDTPNFLISGASSISSASIASGNGGNIEITADQLSIIENSSILTGPFNSGLAGKITFDIGDLVMERSIIDSSSIGSNQAGGTVEIRAERTIQLDQSSINSSTLLGSGTGGTVIVESRQISLQNQSAITADSQQSGRSGNLSIKANTIDLESSSSFSVSSTGQSAVAGDIALTAQTLNLNNDSSITAITESGDGGNLQLGLERALVMRFGSLISTTAGTEQQGGNGGNISITTPFVLGFSNENSDIIANAFSGSGGEIAIAASGIFNFTPSDGRTQVQLRQAATNDISASSQLGTSGILNLSGLNVDPSQGTTEIPTNLIDPANQLAQRCSAERRGGATSAFYITGRGGIAPRPGDPATATYSTGTIQTLVGDGSAPSAVQLPKPLTPAAPLITEASGWKQTATGQVQLIASTEASLPRLLHSPCW